ncbi:polyketide synthase [Apiospora hydei]|uniref:Polyketide synthase n=1 Tax=Apiospora hydei TaxID=1337664 RepID=A0ABR1WX26_9PEZI
MPTIKPIAVVGIGCRLPGESSNTEALWEVLSQGKNCFSKVPEYRFNADAFYHQSDKTGTLTAVGGHFLAEDIAKFDASFFGISPSDAKAMDPQQRALLEVIYEGLENAGIPMESLAGSNTSCHVGCFTRDWSDMQIRDSEPSPKYTILGIGAAMLANRISWFYDWHGPSISLDTACSSSLVALDLACQALNNGDANVAVAAGVNLIFNPDLMMWLSNMSFLAKDGRSKSFDGGADGYGRGEGVAAVILKSLDRALQDGDCIRAVIRGTGTNQDGHTSGITLPSPEAQTNLIRSVYESAKLDFKETGYFEAHIGHTEGAAGLVGLIKAVLMLEKGLIPPSVNITNLSPRIPFDRLGVVVPRQLIPWPTEGLRRATVSSFGYGGTNAHVVVDDAASYLRLAALAGHHNTAHLWDGDSDGGGSSGSDSGIVDETFPSPAPSLPETSGFDFGLKPRPRLFVFSAHDEKSLAAIRQKYAAYLGSQKEMSASEPCFFDRLAFTLHARRSVLPWKTWTVATDMEDTPEAFASQAEPPVRSTSKPRIGFVFTGQGAQWAGMGQELLQYPVFRSSLTSADEYLRERLGCEWSVVEEIGRDAKTSRLHLAKFSQPLCTILQIALTELLGSWGVEATAVVGHSSGEIAAAVCTGALSREDGWEIAYWRGKLSSDLTTRNAALKGAMAAAGTSAEKALEYIKQVTNGTIQVACVNSPESVTLSGDEAAVDEVVDLLKADKLFVRKLKVENAYHSYHMSSIAEEYLASINGCLPSTPSKNIKLLSSVTGRSMDLAGLGPQYWVDNLTSTVVFSDALALLLKGEGRRRRRGETAVDLLVEVGPHAALQGPVKQVLAAEGCRNVAYTSILRRGKDAVASALETAGQLFTHGCSVDVMAVNQVSTNDKCDAPLVNLPTYPWNHGKSYWSESRLRKALRFRTHRRLDLLGAPASDFTRGDPAWKNHLRTSELPWIRDHKIQRTVCTTSGSSFAYPVAHTERELENNCSGFVSLQYQDSNGSDASSRETELEREVFEAAIAAEEAQCQEAMESVDFYARTESLGLQYGPSFRNLADIKSGPASACANVTIPDTASTIPYGYEDEHLIHPATLDCIFQLLYAALGGSSGQLEMAAIPFFIEKLKVATNCPREPGRALRGFARSQALGLVEYAADIAFGKLHGRSPPQIKISGIRCRRIGDCQDHAASATVQQRYGQFRIAPDLALASTADLERYLTPESSSQAEGAFAEAAVALAKILELVAHKDPYATILELGNDTRSALVPALLALSKSGLDLVKSAAFTVASNNKQHSEDEEHIVECRDDRRLNITHESMQSILADREANFKAVVLSADSDLSQLKTATALVGEHGFLLHTAHDWDAAEVTIGHCKSVGFAQTIIIPFPDNHHLVVASRTRSRDSAQMSDSITILLPDSPSETTLALANELALQFESQGLAIVKTHLRPDTLEQVSGSSCISLLELDDRFDLSEDPSRYDTVKNLYLNAKRLLWVSAGSSPHQGVIQGLSRTVKNENPHLDVAHLGLAAASLVDAHHSAVLVARLFLAGTEDREFVVDEGGVLKVSRYAADDAMNAYMLRMLDKNSAQTVPVGQIQTPLKLAIRSPGLLESMWFTADDRWQAQLEPDEIEIETRAIGTNFRDVLVLMGVLSDNLLGLEASGIVRRVGSAVTRFRPGDRVVTSSRGCYRTLHQTKEVMCQAIPEGVDFAEAASVPLVFMTALGALRDLAHLQPGETILIHAAAGGVGQAAIQLAQHYGATVLATVGSPAKAKKLQEAYGISPDHIFHSRDASFVGGVLRATGGRGVDVVLNSLSGELLRQTWHCVAPFGRFVEIGIKDIEENAGLDMAPFKKSTSFAFLNINLMLDEYHQKAGALLADVTQLFSQGVIKPVDSVSSYPVSSLPSAVATMQAGKHIGKVVITLSPQDELSVPTSVANRWQLKGEDATYLIIGGLGGLGRSLALHMSDCGAKNIAVLSRTGSSDPKAAPLRLELEKRGARVVFHGCDVADADQLESSLAKIAAELPPIAGCIHSAMLLRDGVFENMSHTDFRDSLRPKVHGSWNLHRLLPRDLDFFILLSSISGVTGNPGQANYAAGNAFMDQLAAFRRSWGLAATSLDLGLLLDVGFVAERDGVSNLKKWESVGLRDAEFRHLVTAATRGSIPAPGDDGAGGRKGETYALPAQVVCGLATGGHVAAHSLPEPFYFTDPRFAQPVQAELASSSQSTNGPAGADDAKKALRQSLGSSTSLAHAAGVVGEALQARLAAVMDSEPGNIDLRRPLHAYGVDSLMAVEMRNWVVHELQCDISLFDLLGSPNLADLAAKIAGVSRLVPAFESE